MYYIPISQNYNVLTWYCYHQLRASFYFLLPFSFKPVDFQRCYRMFQLLNKSDVKSKNVKDICIRGVTRLPNWAFQWNWKKKKLHSISTRRMWKNAHRSLADQIYGFRPTKVCTILLSLPLIHQLLTNFWLLNSKHLVLINFRMCRPIDDGGKRTFFLVNSTLLVEQQSNFLANFGNFKVLGLSEEYEVDTSSSDAWKLLQSEWQVMHRKIFSLISIITIRSEIFITVSTDRCLWWPPKFIWMRWRIRTWS